LIAAAPELLEALQFMESALIDSEKLASFREIALKKCRAAIAKAEGTENG
jgi:hypothetical protein